jgi:hypothetical protein
MKRVLLMFAAVLLIARAADATTFRFYAVLNGLSESPPNNSPGTGIANVAYDDVLHLLTVDVVFSGLTTGTTASHIHCCTPAAQSGTAGVATTTPTFVNFPLMVTSGTYHNVLDLTLASSYNPAFVTASGSIPGAEMALVGGLFGERTYLNIHTTQNPGGEIRGFLDPVPEPATLSLLGMGLGSLIAARRRRRA